LVCSKILDFPAATALDAALPECDEAVHREEMRGVLDPDTRVVAPVALDFVDLERAGR
jgi:hypothetical protein